MTSPFEGQSFLFIWIGLLLLMSSGIAIFFLWGIRARQFSDQDRARYLPLRSGIPRTEEEEAELRERARREHGRAPS